jgi:uncharacterized membrane protein YfcA
VIALTAGIALMIGWYRGFNLRSLELAAAAFSVVLLVQLAGLVLIRGDLGSNYWPTVAAVAVGWLVCIWVGSRARHVLQR